MKLTSMKKVIQSAFLRLSRHKHQLIYCLVGILCLYMFIRLCIPASNDCFTIVYANSRPNHYDHQFIQSPDGVSNVAPNYEPNNKPIYNNESIIFVITPTYSRATQMPDLTRMAQTLRLVPNIFWIVVEDNQVKSRLIEELLLRNRLQFVHLLGPKPTEDSGRGTSNRIKAMQWLREHYEGSSQKGVIYFADDDNSYDVRVFDEMRDTRGVSMFPVGLIPELGVSSPIVSKKTGKIIGFHVGWFGGRKFAVDMAGFAINLQLFLSKKDATMSYEVGFQEDSILIALGIEIDQIEPKANNCTDVLVWHSQTVRGDELNANHMKRVPQYKDTNLPVLYLKAKGLL